MAVMRISLGIAMATIFLIQATAAVNHTVGAPRGGWGLSTNLAAWASTQKFSKGDNLVFSYNPSYHNVLEVTKANFDTCTASNPIKQYTSGNDVIQLSSVGTKYFICGISGHCLSGMKVQINTVSSATSAPSATPRTPPSTSPVMSPSVSAAAPSSDSPTNKPTESSPSVSAAVMQSAVTFVFGLVLFLFFSM